MKSNFPIITAEQMALVDKIAVENGLLITQMMEYAGINIARFVQNNTEGEVLILVGKGHNGGDGLAAARHLVNWGYGVDILLAESAEMLKETSKQHYNLLYKMDVSMEKWNASSEQKELLNNADLIVDSLLGYNIDGDPRGNYGTLIEEANKSGKKIIAVDIPSGLNGSTGEAYNPCIKAAATLTLALPKTGLIEKKAHKYVGEISVADLGIPSIVYKKAGIDVPEGLFKENSIVKM